MQPTKTKFIRHNPTGRIYLTGSAVDLNINGLKLNAIPYTSIEENDNTLYIREATDFENFSPAAFSIHKKEYFVTDISLMEFDECKVKLNGEWRHLAATLTL